MIQNFFKYHQGEAGELKRKRLNNHIPALSLFLNNTCYMEEQVLHQGCSF